MPCPACVLKLKIAVSSFFLKLILVVSCSFLFKKSFTCLVQHFCKDLLFLLLEKLIHAISAYF